MLILFVHHIAVSIQAPNVVSEVANDLHIAIERLTKEKNPDIENALKLNKELNDNYTSVDIGVDGYVLSIDSESAVKFAKESNLIFKFLVRPGDFISYSTPVVQIWGYFEIEKTKKKINSMIILGTRRSPRYDLESTINELVELAVRALSTGINDPFTAMSVVDHLASELSYLSNREFPNTHVFDEDETLRVILKKLDFNSVVECAFNQIRQAGSSHVSVVSRLLEGLNNITTATTTSENLQPLLRQAHAINDSINENFIEKSIDHKAIKERFDKLEKTLNEKMNLNNDI